MISKNFKKRFYTSVLLLCLLTIMFSSNFISVYLLIILSTLSILEFLQLTKKLSVNKFYFNLMNLFFIIYIFSFSFMFFLFSNIHGLKIILYIILFGCIASDIGGFIFGNLFKGPKLTKISPKKTYSGAIGSVIFSILTVSLFFYYFIRVFEVKILITAFMISIFCQIGDLIFSLLKRKAKLKDTGNFLPGHGGILDRLDGIFLGVPTGFIIFTLLN